MPTRPGDDSTVTMTAGPQERAALPAAPPALTPRLWALLFLLGLLWGGSFFFTQIVIREIPPLPLVAIRVGLAATALLTLLLIARQSLAPLRQRALAFLGLGMLNNAIPFLLLAIGQKTIGGGLAAILNATTPLWTILVAAMFTRDERLSGNKLIGVALGIAGVATLVGPEAIGLGSGAPLTAFLAVLGATLSYACAGVFAKRFRGVPPVVVATGQLCGSSLVMIPLALVSTGGLRLAALQGLSGGVILAMLALALISTAFAYILYFELVAGAGATNASLVTFLVPASAILLGILFLGEALDPREILGFALILLDSRPSMGDGGAAPPRESAHEAFQPRPTRPVHRIGRHHPRAVDPGNEGADRRPRRRDRRLRPPCPARDGGRRCGRHGSAARRAARREG